MEKIVDRRHCEWKDNHLRWRWLLDSYEGGEVYRQAVYGWDTAMFPIRNLIRHKREYPDPTQRNYYGPLGRPAGSDQYTQATDDDYEMRRARTPVPMFLRRAVNSHLSKVFSQDPSRIGPQSYLDWCEDIDGTKTPIRRWVKDTIGPLLLIFGQLDIIIDHPPAPKGERISTGADERRLGLNRCIGSYILPENVVWWELDDLCRYEEVLISEKSDDGESLYRHWEPERWTLYDCNGKQIDQGSHPYGRPPIIRVFDKRRYRSRNIGLPRYEEIAELQREYYNRDSELILSDTHQAHPIVQVPEDQIQGSGAVPTGPGWAWPMKRVQNGPGAEYVPAQILEFPKEAAEQIRKNKQDIQDASDRAALMTKPAGAAGTTGQTVSQSGISKRLDSEDGNVYLSDIAETFATIESQIGELFLLVYGNGQVSQSDSNAIQITYAKDFDLFGPDEMSGLISDYQSSIQGAGATPETDCEMLKRLMRQILKGLSDDRYAQLDGEIDEAIASSARTRLQQQEAAVASIGSENTNPAEQPGYMPVGGAG